MAALVSEYTLEFFTLLNARSKKELIEWCMKEGLIASSYECPECNEQMGLNERKSVLDGFEWRCRKKSLCDVYSMTLRITKDLPRSDLRQKFRGRKRDRHLLRFASRGKGQETANAFLRKFRLHLFPLDRICQNVYFQRSEK
ncbi:uncharacterized protein TNCV_421241 [Trichonephila clavipes]|nr:uncharacterized protein TNCV_421241 [Trichonephila clavipes]